MNSACHRNDLTMRERLAIRLILLALRITSPMEHSHQLSRELETIRAALHQDK